MKKVCVTGASGYIGSCLVKHLLLRGYFVQASVRDPTDERKVRHLIELEGRRDRLILLQAYLLVEGSFDDVVEGCHAVFHTASPYFLATQNPQAELIDPAVKGTLNVLRSCAKMNSVERVVLTSSMAAMIANDRPRTPEVVVDETWWSDPELCKKTQQWYMLSKTLAEDAAWKFVKEKGIDMVVINPSTVIGPMLPKSLNRSTAAVLNLVNGSKKTYPNKTIGLVDVRDVANAHILAYEDPEANGRYPIVGSVIHYSGVVEILHKLYPSLQLPEKCSDDKPFTPTYQVSNEKATSLGVVFTPVEESFKETVESLKEKGFHKVP